METYSVFDDRESKREEKKEGSDGKMTGREKIQHKERNRNEERMRFEIGMKSNG